MLDKDFHIKNADSVRDNFPVQLTRLYIIALSIVAILSIVSQIIIQNALNNQMQDSHIVNRAGRQRMLSQKIAKHCLSIEREIDQGKAFGKDIQELKTSLNQWIIFHEGLNFRKQELNLAGYNSVEIDSLFLLVNPYYISMVHQVNSFIDQVTNTPINNNEIAYTVDSILINERLFLGGMESIVKQYEIEARDRVASIKQIEGMLLISVLIILLLEGFFIFRPAAQEIKGTLKKLKSAQDKLQLTNSELEEKVEARTKEVSQKNLELKMKNERLKAVNKDLDNFVYTSSHDLKAPISNIEGLIHALESSIPEVQEKGGGILNMMYDSIDRFKLVLADLSDTGKVKQEMTGEKESIDFQQISREVILNLDILVKQYEANILLDFLGAPEIHFSRKNLRSILHNLISNSLKYSSQDRRPLIKLTTKRSGDFILLKVSDNGLGIKSEDIPKMFLMYERIHQHVEGTGVGLSMVKKIVESNGGKIEVRSQVNRGTTFCLFLKEG